MNSLKETYINLDTWLQSINLNILIQKTKFTILSSEKNHYTRLSYYSWR